MVRSLLFLSYMLVNFQEKDRINSVTKNEDYGQLKDIKLFWPGLDNTRLFISLTAGAKG